MTKAEALEILTNLNTRFSDVSPKLDIKTKSDQLAGLNAQMSESGFWDNPDNAQKISKQASRLEHFITSWAQIADNLETLQEFVAESDEAGITELTEEINLLNKNFDQSETLVLLSGEYDTNDVILSLHVGNGGQDAEDFCQMLLRMYLRFAEQQGWKAQILEESTSDAGLKSATIEIQGDYAYGLSKGEHGVHRLIRLSPFNAKSLRQTSFAKVEVLPAVETDDNLEIAESDLRFDVFRSSGAGGQSVNTTDSAVRVTYLPLNLVVTCQNEKSQHQNKATALKILKSRLAQIKLEQQAERLDELRGEKLDANFGSQIRTYTLQPYKLVKDHRTDFEHNNPDKVLDGDLDGFVQAWLKRAE